jgi:hypothetical protein
MERRPPGRGRPPLGKPRRVMNRAAPFFFVAAGCLAAAAALGADGVALRYRFEPGETITMDVTHRALTETTIGAARQSVETATDSTKIWTIVAVDADGRATIEHSVGDVTMTSRASDKGETRWSSRDPGPVPPDYEAVTQSLGVPLSRVEVDTTGRVLARRDFKPTPPSSTGDLMVVPLPDEPASVGTEWTVPQEVVVEVPNGPRKAVKTRLRYRVESLRDGIATIHVDTTVLTPLDDPRLEARLLERIWDGEIEFDVARGRLLRRSTGVDRRVVGFSGPESSVRYKASLEERLQ